MMKGGLEVYLEWSGISRMQRRRVLFRRGRIAAIFAVAVVLLLGMEPAAAVADDSAPATHEEFNKAHEALRSAASTEADIRAAVDVFDRFLKRPELAESNRKNIQSIRDYAVSSYDRANVFRELHVTFENITQQHKDIGLNLANPAHLKAARDGGQFNYQLRYPGGAYLGVDKLFWSKLKEFEGEALAQFIAKQNGQPVPPPAAATPESAPVPEVPGTPQATPTDATPAPAAASPVTFQAGDGAEKAKEYLVSKKLTFLEPRSGSNKPGIWILAGEAELKTKIKAVVKANGEFVKIRKEIKKIEEAMPGYDALEKKLKEKIARLTKEINEKWFLPNERKKKERERLQTEIARKVTPMKKALANANERSDAAYDKCARLLDEAAASLEDVVQGYAVLTEDDFIFDALGEAGGELGPTPQLNKQHRQLGKLRVVFERAASK